LTVPPARSGWRDDAEDANSQVCIGYADRETLTEKEFRRAFQKKVESNQERVGETDYKSL